jgi:hypothetical protein
MRDINFLRAVQAWKDMQSDGRQLAYYASLVDDGMTKRLADACGISVDKIESYRLAYRLYYANCESDTYRKLWEGLNISLWIVTARSKNPKRMEYLQEAAERKYTVEQLRAVLVVDNKPEWTLRLQRIVKQVWKLLTDYKPEIETAKRERFEEAVKAFYKAVEELAK